MSERRIVGFDRRIDLAWLDATADFVLQGADAATVRGHLWAVLEGVVPGTNANSARGKTITVLSHIWSAVPTGARGLRDRALRLPATRPPERLAVHWAMVIATYPFAADVAAALGRLLALHEAVGLSQVTRKVCSIWGERATVLRATQRVVRSMVEWGVLLDGPQRGTYAAACKARPIRGDVALLALEATLLSSGSAHGCVGQLATHPAWFPFVITTTAAELRRAPQFSVAHETLGGSEIALGR